MRMIFNNEITPSHETTDQQKAFFDCVKCQLQSVAVLTPIAELRARSSHNVYGRWISGVHVSWVEVAKRAVWN